MIVQIYGVLSEVVFPIASVPGALPPERADSPVDAASIVTRSDWFLSVPHVVFM